MVYDAGDGQAAARAWWTLRWAGPPAMSGSSTAGIAAWVAAGRPVPTESHNPATGDIAVRPGGLPVLDADAAAELARRHGVLLDARVGAALPGRGRAGRPGRRPHPGRRQPAGRRPHRRRTAGCCPPTELRERFAGRRHGRGPVGAYCGSGVTAAQTVLALHRAGRTDAALYVGSWSDWVTDPARPVATRGG